MEGRLHINKIGLNTSIRRYATSLLGDIDLCAEFEMLKVKVLILFLGTAGFSPPRDGRYALYSYRLLVS